MKRHEMDELLDRVAAAAPHLPTAVIADANIEPGHMMVALRTPSGSVVLAIDAKDWNPLRAAEVMGFEVSPEVRKAASEVLRGEWTQAAQERRARAAQAAATVSAEKKAPASARPTKQARS